MPEKTDTLSAERVLRELHLAFEVFPDEMKFHEKLVSEEVTFVKERSKDFWPVLTTFRATVCLSIGAVFEELNSSNQWSQFQDSLSLKVI